MSDFADPPAAGADSAAAGATAGDPSPEAPAEHEDSPYPWEREPAEAAADPDSPRERHDAFTEARKCEFLRALVKTGCLLDAARLTGVSPRTVYKHQERDPRFLDHCRTALRMSATPVEITAWQRAVEGVEQEYAVAGEVRVRRRYADGLLRLLLQGSNPKKYGPRPGFTRKRLLKHERKRIEREVRAELEAAALPRPLESVRESILRKIAAIERHREPKLLAAGWTKSPEGHWVPPGYGPIPVRASPDSPAGVEADEGGEGGAGPDAPSDSL